MSEYLRSSIRHAEDIPIRDFLGYAIAVGEGDFVTYECSEKVDGIAVAIGYDEFGLYYRSAHSPKVRGFYSQMTRKDGTQPDEDLAIVDMFDCFWNDLQYEAPLRARIWQALNGRGELRFEMWAKRWFGDRNQMVRSPIFDVMAPDWSFQMVLMTKDEDLQAVYAVDLVSIFNDSSDGFRFHMPARIEMLVDAVSLEQIRNALPDDLKWQYFDATHFMDPTKQRNVLSAWIASARNGEAKVVKERVKLHWLAHVEELRRSLRLVPSTFSGIPEGYVVESDSGLGTFKVIFPEWKLLGLNKVLFTKE